MKKLNEIVVLNEHYLRLEHLHNGLIISYSIIKITAEMMTLDNAALGMY